jgi:hypothetical protein
MSCLIRHGIFCQSGLVIDLGAAPRNETGSDRHLDISEVGYPPTRSFCYTFALQELPSSGKRDHIHSPPEKSFLHAYINTSTKL